MAHYITDAEGKLHKIAGNFNPSYNVNQLVVEKTFGSGSLFEINGLDLERDGGVYDIIIIPPKNSTASNLKFRLNNVSSSASYIHSFYDINPQNKSISVGSQSSDTSALLGTYSPENNIGFMTLAMSNGVPMWEIGTLGYVGRLDYQKFFGYTVAGNVTSMQIIPNTTPISAGLTIKIYKRMANATVMDSKLVADKITLGTTLTNQNDTVVESYVSSDGKTWYRKWASGWKECGMEVQHSGSISSGGIASYYITLPIEFSNTVYTVEMTTLYAGSASARCVWSYEAPTTNQMYAVIVNFGSGSSTSPKCKIYCCGF